MAVVLRGAVGAAAVRLFPGAQAKEGRRSAARRDGPVAALVPPSRLRRRCRGEPVAPAVRSRDDPDRLAFIHRRRVHVGEEYKSLHGFYTGAQRTMKRIAPNDVGARIGHFRLLPASLRRKFVGRAPAAGTELIRTGAPCPSAFRTGTCRPRPAAVPRNPGRNPQPSLATAGPAKELQEARCPRAAPAGAGSVVAVGGRRQRPWSTSERTLAPRCSRGQRRRALPPDPPLGGEASTAPRRHGRRRSRHPLGSRSCPWARALPRTQHSESSNISRRDMTTSRTCNVSFNDSKK